MSDFNSSELNYPEDAAGVRNLIREMLQSQVDHGTHMDGGGGFGSADLWATFGGQEFIITVQPTNKFGTPVPRPHHS